MKSVVNCIKRLLNKVRAYYKKKSILQYVSSVNQIFNVGLPASISLQWGSTKDDIILEKEVDLYGTLISINHGKILMHEYSKIGPGSKIVCVNNVEIGEYTAIAQNVTIVDTNYHPLNPQDRLFMRTTSHESQYRSAQYGANAPIKIGSNCMIGDNVRVCKGVTIGDNSIIGACSVVTKDIPANCIAVGNPAKVVKTNIDLTTTPIFPIEGVV